MKKTIKSKISKVVVFSLVSCLTYYFCVPHYTFTYHYSKDQKQVITAVHYFHWLSPKKERTYYAYGFVDKREKPKSYIEMYRTHELFVIWQEKGCIIYAPSSFRKAVKLPKSIKFYDSLPPRDFIWKLQDYKHIRVG